VIEGVDRRNSGNTLSSPGSSLDTYDDGNIAGNLVVDVCASTNRGCNRGQPQFGIAIGESDSFQLTLYGDFDTSDLTLAVFGIKWQTNGGSFEQPGVPNPMPPIPEPTTISLMGLGLVGLGVVGRKRQRLPRRSSSTLSVLDAHPRSDMN
jgi:hypothetical protein